MSDHHLSSEARSALELARSKVSSSYQAGAKWGLFMMIGVITGCTILPFILTKKETLPVTDSAVYLLSVFSMAAVWFLLGNLNEKRVRNAYAKQNHRAYIWGTPLELLVYYGLFFPLIFFTIFWGSQKLGYFGFNYSLLFISTALCSLCTPAWLSGITIVLNVTLFACIARFVFGWNIDPIDSIGIAFGLGFTAMMIFFWKNESLIRTASEVLVNELDSANEKLRDYSLKAEELAATEERNRIAREIHDTLGHSLTVVNVQLEAAQKLLDTDQNRARKFIAKARQLSQDGLQGIRASISSLRASPLDGKSLIESLEELVAQTRTAGFQAQLSLTGEPHPLDWKLETALFRTAQEALTNARKHSQAKRIDLKLDFTQDQHVSLTISDDGVGCQNPEGGYGILGIQERIQYLDGQSRIDTAPGQGFRLEVDLPQTIAEKE